MDKYLEEIILLSKWYNKELTDDEFLEKFKLEKIRYRREVPNIAKEKLKEACTLKNGDMMMYYSHLVFCLVFSSKIDFDEIKDSIEEIITGNWHGDHENIAGAFEDIASPKTIEWVYYLVLAHQFEAYEGGIAMARKCLHALGKINTPKSKEKLEFFFTPVSQFKGIFNMSMKEVKKIYTEREVLRDKIFKNN